MFEYFDTWLLWKIDVEDDNIRTKFVGIGGGFVEEPHCLLAIPRKTEVDSKVRPFDSSLDEIHIRLVILDDEDLPAAGRGRFFRPGG